MCNIMIVRQLFYLIKASLKVCMAQTIGYSSSLMPLTIDCLIV